MPPASTMIFWVLAAFLFLLLAYIALAFLAAGVSLAQEIKLWKDLNPITPFGMVKVYLLNVTWMVTCLFGSMGLLMYHVLSGDVFRSDASERLQKMAHCVIERHVANFLVSFYLGPVEVKGLENLPSDEPGVPAPVYVANHASQLDTAIVYRLARRFRWIAKSSVVYLPGVGQIMWLSGHVFIDRFSKKSSKQPQVGVKTTARNLYIQSDKSIQEGVPMFFFPQGTRRIVERMPFKDGAFKVALSNKSDLVPISIEHAIDAWTSSHPFGSRDTPAAIVTIHKPIPVTESSDIEQIKKQCADVIYSVLPDYRKKEE